MKLIKSSGFFLFVVLLVLIAAGIFAYYYVNVSDTTEDQAVAGTQFELQFKDNSLFKVTDLLLHYKVGAEFKTISTSEHANDTDYIFTLDLEEDQSELEYYFTYNYLTFPKQYPTDQTINLTVSKNIDDLKDSEFKISDYEFADIDNKTDLEFSLELDSNYLVSEVWLNTKINLKENVSTSMIKQAEANQYKLTVHSDKPIKNLEYSYKVVQANLNKTIPDTSVVVNNPEIAKLIVEVENYAKARNIDASFTYLNVSGSEVILNGDIPRESASVIKVLVMIETYNQINSGKLKLTDNVNKYGFSSTVQNALNQMMMFSSNAATGALAQKLGGKDVINATIQKYMGADTKLHFEYSPTHQGIQGEGSGENRITTTEMAKLMMMLHNGEIINTEYSKKMLDLMAQCYDWFGVKNAVKTIETISMKTGYYNNGHYGLAGFVKTKKGSEFAFGVYIYNPTGASPTNLKNIFKIIYGYADSGKI